MILIVGVVIVGRWSTSNIRWLFYTNAHSLFKRYDGNSRVRGKTKYREGLNERPQTYRRPIRERKCPAMLSLTGVHIVSRFTIDHGAIPRMVQERTSDVALRKYGYHKTRVDQPRGKTRPSKESHLHEAWCANHPDEASAGSRT